jgi:hypothetical protein
MKNNPARELTVDEAREKFLHHIWTMIQYWDKLDGRKSSQSERLQGLAFSLLVALDGQAADLPGFKVIPIKMSESDKEFLKSLPKDDQFPRQWFPHEDIIGGKMLHDDFYHFGRNNGFIKD